MITAIAIADLPIPIYAAYLEADQANRDFMNEWINGGHSLSEVEYLRYYRGAAERIYFAVIDEQIEAISTANQNPAAEPEHLDTPHWPGYLIACDACELIMQEQAEFEYDNRERS